jgi:hypothetical protein
VTVSNVGILRANTVSGIFQARKTSNGISIRNIIVIANINVHTARPLGIEKIMAGGIYSNSIVSKQNH